MRILLVHQYFLRKDSGGGSRWNQFAKYWSEKGHKITVLAGMLDEKSRKYQDCKHKFIVKEKVSDSITVIRCHVSEAYNVSPLGRMWGYISFGFSSTIAGLFVKKPDVIICTSPPLIVGMTGAVLSRFKRIPMVFEVRDLWPESVVEIGAVKNKWVIKFLYWMQKVSYRSSKWINVLTPAFEETLVNSSGVPREMISMIPNAADLDIIRPGPRDNWVREKYDLGGKYVVSYVGAHGTANYLMQLIDAAKMLKEQAPDVQLMLIGDGMQKSMLISEAERVGLDNITFVDPVSKETIGDFINASDACTAVLKGIEVYKTVYPNKVFDYMSAAKPIILGIDGVARKLVEEANAGIFVQPENALSFTEAVMKLKNNPHLAAEFGRNGLAYVHKNYDRKKLAEKYISLIEKIVKEQKQK